MSYNTLKKVPTIIPTFNILCVTLRVLIMQLMFVSVCVCVCVYLFTVYFLNDNNDLFRRFANMPKFKCCFSLRPNQLEIL